MKYPSSSIARAMPELTMRHLAIAAISSAVVLLPFLTKVLPGGLGILPNRWVTVGILGATYAMLSLGLVVATGWCRLLVLGYSGFFAIGAYTYGLLNSYTFGLHLGAMISVPLAIAINIVIALFLGLATLRTRGDYFALITLAFGEMVRISITNLREFTGGSAGLLAIDPLTLFPNSLGPSVSSPGGRYATGWIVVGLLLLWMSFLRRTPLGRAWVAIREDEEAARSVGIHTFRAKLTALSIAAGIAGFAGCFFAASQLSLSPSTFSMLSSFIVVTALIVGGLGSSWGAVLGTLLLLSIPEVVRDMSGGSAALFDYQMLIYGTAMVVVILAKPTGILQEPAQDLQLQEDSPRDPLTDGGALLQLKSLEARYGGVIALKNVDFELKPGQLVGIIGPNGSGKTTLLNVISGFHPPSAGVITIDGKIINTWTPEKRAESGVSRTFQMNRLFTGISNAENVLIACDKVHSPPGIRDLKGIGGRDARSHQRASLCLSEFPERFPRFRWKATPLTLSYANRRRIEAARAIGTKPKVLLLDEPTAGMNPVDRHELLDRVRQWANGGVAVIVVEHQLGALARVADRLIAFDHGVIIANGPPDQVLKSPEVVRTLMSMEPSG